jgi:hypothetical protein
MPATRCQSPRAFIWSSQTSLSNLLTRHILSYCELVSHAWPQGLPHISGPLLARAPIQAMRSLRVEGFRLEHHMCHCSQCSFQMLPCRQHGWDALLDCWGTCWGGSKSTTPSICCNVALWGPAAATEHRCSECSCMGRQHQDAGLDSDCAALCGSAEYSLASSVCISIPDTAAVHDQGCWVWTRTQFAAAATFLLVLS